MEQVSGGARPRQGTGCCYGGEPQVVTENSLFPHTRVPPGAHTCCQSRPCSHPLPVPGVAPIALGCQWVGAVAASPNRPSGLLHLPLLLRGNRGQQPPLAPIAGNGPVQTRCQRQPHSHLQPEPPLAPTASTRCQS